MLRIDMINQNSVQRSVHHCISSQHTFNGSGAVLRPSHWHSSHSKTCRVATYAYQPSSRRLTVLQSHEKEFFWGHIGGYQAPSKSESCSDAHEEGQGSSLVIPGPRLLQRRIEAACSLTSLMAVLQDSGVQWDPMSIRMACFRLAKWSPESSNHSIEDPQCMLNCAIKLEELLVDALITKDGALPAFDAANMADILWAVATLQFSVHAEPHYVNAQLLPAVTTWAMHQGDFMACDTSDLISMLWGYCTLIQSQHGTLEVADDACGHPQLPSSFSKVDQPSHHPASYHHNHQHQQQPSSMRMDRQAAGHAAGELKQLQGQVVDSLAAPLSSRIRGLEDSFQPEDLTDIIWALAAAHHKSPAVAHLIEAVAHEVYRQISNRHSLKGMFLPRDLVKLLCSFADLQRSDVSISRMLDAIAGYVVKRIRAKHVQAMTKPADIAALLKAYADLGHNSVVIPELVAATAQQLVLELASHHEWIHSNVTIVSSTFAGANPSAPDKSFEDVWAKSWSLFIKPATASSILSSYHQLGMYPGQALISSLLVATTPQLHRTPLPVLVTLLCIMADFCHHPGQQTLHMLVSALQRSKADCSPQQWSQVFHACATLGFMPPLGLVQYVCQRCLLGDEFCHEPEHEITNDHTHDDAPSTSSSNSILLPGTGSSSHSSIGHTSSASSRLSATDICCLLFSLVVWKQVTIQRLGLACMQLRDAAPGLTGTRASTPGLTAGLSRDGLPPLVSLAAAVLVLGEEGQEMLEETMPHLMVIQMQKALRSYLQEWAERLDPNHTSKLATALELLPMLQPCTAAVQVSGVDISRYALFHVTHGVRGWGAVPASCNVAVAGHANAGSGAATRLEVDGAVGTWGLGSKNRPAPVILDICGPEAFAVNNPTCLLGSVLLRHELLALLGLQPVVLSKRELRGLSSKEDFAAYVHAAVSSALA